MKVYLAADYARKQEMQYIRSILETYGLAVTSRWLDTPDDGVPWSAEAKVDLEDIREADALISFTTGEHARGGRHAEFGMAVAWRKRLVLVGPREHVFHFLPDVLLLNKMEQLFNWAKVVA